MFDWLYRKISTGLSKNLDIKKLVLEQIDVNALFLDLIQNEETQGAIVAFVDGLYERYRAKVLGTIGGLNKGLNAMTDEANPLVNVLDNKGHINLKKLIPYFLSNYNKNDGQTKGGLP